METKFARAGTFCLNEACEAYGKVESPNLIKFGKTPGGVQRYRCKTCGKTFTATKGTLFFKRRTPVKDILETLVLLSDGVRISAISRAKGFKEDTILAWLRQAAQHAEAIEQVLLSDYRLSRAQIDGLWAYVKRKGKKGGSTPKRASSSVAP